jgi:quercetin dioxygenase-like cupin family protein
MEVVRLPEIEEMKGQGFSLRQLLNPNTVGTKNAQLFFVQIEPGGSIPVHRHGPAEVMIYVLEGAATFLVDEEKETLGPETALYVPAGSGIGLENRDSSPLRFVVAMAPPVSVETCPVCGILIGESEAAPNTGQP